MTDQDKHEQDKHEHDGERRGPLKSEKDTTTEPGGPAIAKGKGAGVSGGKGKPVWTGSLKSLYDSVVDEPLPDNLKDLLSKLGDETKK